MKFKEIKILCDDCIHKDLCYFQHSFERTALRMNDRMKNYKEKGLKDSDDISPFMYNLSCEKYMTFKDTDIATTKAYLNTLYGTKKESEDDE